MMKAFIVKALSAFCFLLLQNNISAQLREGDVIRIKSVHSGKYIKPGLTISDNNEQLVLSSAINDETCKWRVVVDFFPGTRASTHYKFQNISTNKFLGLYNSSKEKYGLICQKPGSNKADLEWKLESTATAFKIKNVNSGHYIAVEGGGKANNSKLVQWSDDGQPDILWQFENVSSIPSSGSGPKVMLDVALNYIAVSEATRNRIDNGDCKRVFGQVSTELWELDANNEMVRRLSSYNNQPEMIFNQRNAENPPTAALSYYQDDKNAMANNQMRKVTYNIPESLLINRKLMLIIKTHLGTRHKDSDLSSYDFLSMKEATSHTFILNNSRNLSEEIMVTTDLVANRARLNIDPYPVSPTAPQPDDTHYLWIKFSAKKN